LGPRISDEDSNPCRQRVSAVLESASRLSGRPHVEPVRIHDLQALDEVKRMAIGQICGHGPAEAIESEEVGHALRRALYAALVTGRSVAPRCSEVRLIRPGVKYFRHTARALSSEKALQENTSR